MAGVSAGEGSPASDQITRPRAQPNGLRARSAILIASIMLTVSLARLATVPLRITAAWLVLGGALLGVTIVALGVRAVLARYADPGDRLRLDSGGAVIALALLGPLAAFLLDAWPDLTARPRELRTLTRMANLASYATGLLAATLVMRSAGVRPGMPHASVREAAATTAAGLTYLVVNYMVTRGLDVMLAGRQPVIATIRRELIPALPSVIAIVLASAASAVLTAAIGPLGLLALTLAAIAPQLAAASLTSRSLARVPIPRATVILRGALADELHLPRRQLARIEQTAAGHPPPDITRSELLAAVHLQICRTAAPSQPAYRPPIETQAIILAERWAAFTARSTPALSHSEALGQLASRHNHHFRDALHAAHAIVAREQAAGTVIAPTPLLTGLPQRLRMPVLKRLAVRSSR